MYIIIKMNIGRVQFKSTDNLVLKKKYVFVNESSHLVIHGVLFSKRHHVMRFINASQNGMVFSSYYINRIFPYVFYEIAPMKNVIQDAMELRALLLILRRIIGDERFTY